MNVQNLKEILTKIRNKSFLLNKIIVDFKKIYFVW